MANALKVADTNPRFIDPKAPLAAQVDAINSFINNPPENPRRARISPALAQYILSNLNDVGHFRNRVRRKNDVARYAEDMKNGRWVLTGDTIKFGMSGILRDGQHRLAACVDAGVPFETFIIYGVDEKAFMVLDTGRRRIGADVFHVEGLADSAIASNATRWLLILASDDPSARATAFTNEHLLRVFKSLDQTRVRDCIKDAKAMCKGLRYVHANVVAAMLYLYGMHDDAATDKFVSDFLNSRGSAGMMMEVLSARFRNAQGRIHENVRNGLLIMALNSYIEGKRLTKKKLEAWDLASDGFPALAMEIPEVL